MYLFVCSSQYRVAMVGGLGHLLGGNALRINIWFKLGFLLQKELSQMVKDM